MTIKTIDVNAKEWFDKLNGNSYFAGKVTLNYGTDTEKVIMMPFQYGYGSQYMQEASAVLEKETNAKDTYPLYRYCENNSIILRHNIEINCLLKQLKNI